VPRTLDNFKEIAYRVVAQAGAQSERSRLHDKRSALGPTLGRQSVSQEVVDEVLQRRPRAPHLCFEALRDVIFQS
jgi:hypothetical protein